MFDPCLLSLVDAVTSRALAPLPSLVELANELLMLRAVYREDDRRQHRLKPFRERPNSNSNASDITLLPTLEVTAFTAATAAHRLKNDPRRSPQLDEKRRGCNRAA